jgi:hypothetical protein
MYNTEVHTTYWVKQNVTCNAICLGRFENGQSQDVVNVVSSRIPMNHLTQSDEN